MAPTKSFLVCTTHRTGSTLLCQALRSIQRCGQPGEFFKDDGMVLAANRGVPVEPGMNYGEFIEALKNGTATPNGVFGAKIMWNHLDPLCDRLAEAKGEPRSSRSEAGWLDAHFPDLHYIWLRREDVVLQAISSWKAKQTSIYHQPSGHDLREPVQEARYDFHEIRKIRDRFLRNADHWEALFESHGITPHKVTYEEVCADLHGCVLKILEFLGEPYEDLTQPPKTNLQKLADAQTEEWRSRFLEEEEAKS